MVRNLLILLFFIQSICIAFADDIDFLRLPDSSVVYLKGRIDELSSKKVIADLKKLDKKGNKIYLLINSPGGSVEHGYQIAQTMEALDAELTCVVETKAYSMAALISAYCPKLYIHKFAMMMYHEASYGAEGNETEMRVLQEATQKWLDQLFEDTAKKLHMDLKTFRAKIHDDWWITAKESKEFGISQGIINKLKYEEPPAPANILPFFMPFFGKLFKQITTYLLY